MSMIQAAYNVGGRTISVDMIQNSILGCRLPRPGQVNLIFMLLDYSYSCCSPFTYELNHINYYVKVTSIHFCHCIHFCSDLSSVTDYTYILSGYGCYFLQKPNSKSEMHEKHMRLTILNLSFILHCALEGSLILR